MGQKMTSSEAEGDGQHGGGVPASAESKESQVNG